MESVRGSRTERKKEETKQKIITVAMDLFIKQGFDQTTVDQIAEEADIAKGTIYNHFTEKEAIICEYVQGIIREQAPDALNLLQKLPDTRSRLIAALRKSLKWFHVELNKDIYERYLTYRMQNTVRFIWEGDRSLSSGFNGFLVQIIELGKETGEIRQDVHSIVLAAHLENMHITAAILWLTHPELISIHDGIIINVDLFLKGAENRGSNI